MFKLKSRVVLICAFVLSLPAITPRLYSSDEVQYFSYLRSLWFDHDLSFDNEYRHFYESGVARSDGFRETFLERTTDTGRRINFGTIGCAILWSPFYAVGDAVAHLTGAPADGYSRPYVAAVAYGSAFYGFVAVLLGIACAQRLGFPGTIAGLLVWLGTPLLFYMYVAPPFSHACSAFAVALFVTVWLRVRERWTPGGVVALGVSAALMAMVREQDAFFVAGPAVDFLIALAGGPARLPAAAAGVLGGLAAYSPQLMAYVRLNGHVGPHASVEHKMSWSAPHALQVLFSTEHGYFLWTPIAILAIAGLVAMASQPDKRRIAGCMLLMVAVQVYIGGSVESWTVAGGFGQRRFVALSALLIVGLAGGMARMAAAPAPLRRTAVAVTALAVYWNVALSAEFAIGAMDRQRLQPARNAYDAFVTIPLEAPSLAYRYLFDRQSFYARQHAS
ncbi:MAG TPA: hypothetical protein VL484_03985 [Vicinamibacterales bacterium]|nr:hypothetical protein [Vicinamibacterales bacterium]